MFRARSNPLGLATSAEPLPVGRTSSATDDDDSASIYSGVTISQARGTAGPLYDPELSADVRSFVSLESNFTSPTYVEAPTRHNRGNPRFRDSLATLTNPQRHSEAPQAAAAAILPPDIGRDFVFHMGSQPQPWATLRLLDTKARGRHPHYYGSDRITGHIELSLSTPQTIKSTKLVLKATMVATNQLKILDQTYPIWDRKDGDPRKPGVRFDGQLEGELILPFSIPFPTHVKLSTLSAMNVTEDEQSNTELTNEPPFNSSENQISASSSSSSKSPSSPKRRPRWGFSAFSNKSSSQKPSRDPVVDGNNVSETERAELLPQSFLERDIFANIRYGLTLAVTHGKFSSDSRVGTTIAYTPRSKPPPMLLTRQLVYHDGGLLTGPGNDPKGWHMFEPVSIRGTFLDERVVEVDYTLYLAKPLSYARGTVIPCYMTVACADEMVLNLLSNPLTPRVTLRRSVLFSGIQTNDEVFNHSGPMVSGAWNLGGSGSAKLRPPTSAFEQVSTRRRILQVQSELGNLANDWGDEGLKPEAKREKGVEAVWWSPEDPTDDLEHQPNLTVLQGEIHLPKELQPSCPFPLLTISYCVELLAPSLSAFVPHGQGSELPGSSKGKMPTPKVPYDGRAYASQAVEITTDVREDEPFPTAFTRRSDN